jgi:hypothetical protein
MRISPALLDGSCSTPLRDAPNECCGVVAVRDGRRGGRAPAGEPRGEPVRFEVDGMALHTC